MKEFTFLKLEYLNGLRFKHMTNHGSAEDFHLSISRRESISLIKYIQGVLTGSIKSNIVRSFNNYDISVSMIDSNTFTISVVENRSRVLCKPIGDFMYSGYMGNVHMLDGLASALC